MEELLKVAYDQPLGLALAIIFLGLFLTERIVAGKTHQRALKTIEIQEAAIADLAAAAAANTKTNELALGIIQAHDEKARREGRK